MHAKNALLATLDDSALDSFRPHFEAVDLPFKTILHEKDAVIEHVYFPQEGVGSLVNEPNPGDIVEVATIGNEGMVGVPLVLGAQTMPSRTIIQIPGRGIRIAAEPFLDLIERHSDFRGLLLRYTLALMNQIAQSTSCNRLHEVQERCARWLLHTHDRVTEDSFPLTQEFLAQMLGCHRPTVSIAANMLQKAGLIRYSRGTIKIIDRHGLEEASCACYGIITRQYSDLLASSLRQAERGPAEL